MIWYLVASGFVLLTLVSIAFAPFGGEHAGENKKQPSPPQAPGSTRGAEKVRVTASGEDRINNAIRHWTTARADADIEYRSPAPEPPPSADSSESTTFEDSAPEQAVQLAEAEPEKLNTSITQAIELIDPEFENAPNFYDILQISRHADLETIRRVYRIIAAHRHPDNPVSGDHERFLQLQEAYNVLSDPSRRSQYDSAMRGHEIRPLPIFGRRMFAEGPYGEMNRRFGVLVLLYEHRRLNQGSRGISVLQIERRMSVPREHLEFTLWYLRVSGFIQALEDNSDYVITVPGVNYLESNISNSSTVRDLLTATPPATTLLPQATVRKSQREAKSKTPHSSIARRRASARRVHR